MSKVAYVVLRYYRCAANAAVRERPVIAGDIVRLLCGNSGLEERFPDSDVTTSEAPRGKLHPALHPDLCLPASRPATVIGAWFPPPRSER